MMKREGLLSSLLLSFSSLWRLSSLISCPCNYSKITVTFAFNSFRRSDIPQMNIVERSLNK